MTLDHLFVTYYMQTTLSGIVAIASFIKFEKRSPQVKLIGLSFLLSFISNVGAYVILKSPMAEYMNVPAHIFVVVNFCILTALYYSVLPKANRVWLFVAVSTFIPFWFYSTVILRKPFQESYAAFTNAFFMITFTVLYFYRLMVDLPAVHLHRLPMFWFNSAFLFFNAGTLFLFAFTSYLINVFDHDIIPYWTFHNCVSILEHIIVLIGLSFDFKTLRADSTLESHL
jgi:hypothetical protein